MPSSLPLTIARPHAHHPDSLPKTPNACPPRTKRTDGLPRRRLAYHEVEVQHRKRSPQHHKTPTRRPLIIFKPKQTNTSRKGSLGWEKHRPPATTICPCRVHMALDRCFEGNKELFTPPVALVVSTKQQRRKTPRGTGFANSKKKSTLHSRRVPRSSNNPANPPPPRHVDKCTTTSVQHGRRPAPWAGAERGLATLFSFTRRI